MPSPVRLVLRLGDDDDLRTRGFAARSGVASGCPFAASKTTPLAARADAPRSTAATGPATRARKRTGFGNPPPDEPCARAEWNGQVARSCQV